MSLSRQSQYDSLPAGSTSGYVSRFTVQKTYKAGEGFSRNVELSLAKISHDVGDSVSISFVFLGVSDLELDDAFNLDSSMSVVVRDISSWQLEGVRYQITDGCEHNLSLKCHDFEYTLHQ